MSMTQLEQTIVTTARQHQEVLAKHYYPKQKAGFTRDESEYYDHHRSALTTLLILGHQANSGLGREAVSELLRIESDDAAALGGGVDRQPRATPTNRDNTTRVLP